MTNLCWTRPFVMCLAIILTSPVSHVSWAAVSVPCGTDATVQNAINANPAGTVFTLAASCTYTFASQVVPKSNDEFDGAGVTSTIIDGGLGEHAGWFPGGNSTGVGSATGVTIANMTMQHFGPATAANADYTSKAINTADGWTVKDNKLINNVTAIAGIGNGVTVVNNQINNNLAYAVLANPGPFPSSTAGWLVQGNEIGNNNTLLWDTCTGSVNKYLDHPGSSNNSVKFLNNYVHDNAGAGYWYDTGHNTTNLVQGNTFIRNGSGGVISEVTTGKFTIQHNVFIDNGNSSVQSASTCGNWFPYPNIWIHGSPFTVVAYNNLSNEKGPTSPGGSYGGLLLGISDDDCRGSGLNVGHNLIHDNAVTFKAAASGSGINSQSGTWGTWYACATGYGHPCACSNNNKFHVPGGTISDPHFAWFPNWTTIISFSAFQAAGQEGGGTIDTVDASVPGCTGPWPGVSGVGICPNGSGW